MTDATGFRSTRAKVALTHRGIEGLKPEHQAYRVPDASRPGLAIRVAPGGFKSWDLAYRVRGAGPRRRSLGEFPLVGLDAARTRATELINGAKLGKDIVADEQAAKAALEARTTVAELLEQYLSRMVRGRLRTQREMEVRLKRVLKPLRSRYAGDLRRRDLRLLFDATADFGKRREAEKQRQMVQGMFRWAVSQDIVEIDPTMGLKSYDYYRRRDRVLSPEEIKLFWGWLGTCGMASDYAEALRLQLATGARIGEVVGMSAGEVDRSTWIWTLPAERSKNGRSRQTPLVGLAREIVDARLNGIAGGLLFSTEKGKALTSNCVGSLLVKRRNSMSIPHFTSHDLRRTVATQMADLEIPEDVIAKVLGHESGGKEARTLMRHYVRSGFIEVKARALELWDRQLRCIIDRTATPVTFLPVRRSPSWCAVRAIGRTPWSSNPFWLRQQARPHVVPH